MNRLSQFKGVIYRLKRAYGQPVAIHFQTSSSVDVSTGVKSLTRDVIQVSKAVVLPSLIHRDIKYDIGYLKANSNFTYGGVFTEGTRQVLLDKSDLPRDFTINVVDTQYIVFQRKRYAIKSVDELEVPCYCITMQETKGVAVNQIHVASVHDRLTIDQAFAGVIP